MRAYFLRCAVEAFDALAAGSDVPPALQETLDALRKMRARDTLGFLPLELLLPLTEAARAQLGPEGARELVLDSMRRAMGAPLWQRMILRAFELFGVTLPGMARWVPHLYPRVFRDTGRLRVVEAAADHARIAFEQVPLECFEAPAYLSALPDALGFFFELSHTRGRVLLEGCDPEQGLLSYLLRVDA